ncbi:hypothetical protein [Herbihabitans rhizosphaerae]|uniref:hypothetical protein n=1 Tax=Herbihabitans rhizosphaerae TaxID=1872711 RepID=UPI00102BEB27|nr:hypothetical protein [Herbihabitans rhizosphaerae]
MEPLLLIFLIVAGGTFAVGACVGAELHGYVVRRQEARHVRERRALNEAWRRVHRDLGVERTPQLVSARDDELHGSRQRLPEEVSLRRIGPRPEAEGNRFLD